MDFIIQVGDKNTKHFSDSEPLGEFIRRMLRVLCGRLWDNRRVSSREQISFILSPEIHPESAFNARERDQLSHVHIYARDSRG